MTPDTPAGGAVAIGYMDPAADFLLPKPDGCVLSAHIDLLLVRDSRSPFTQPVYTTPPATVPLDAVRGLVARIDRKIAATDGGLPGSWNEWQHKTYVDIRDELEALTREATK